MIGSKYPREVRWLDDNRLTKKVFIKSYGCQMNLYDAARMADVLAPLGYAPAASPEAADLIILNTCHVREKASEKVFSELGRLRSLKDTKGTLIAVGGCVAQAEGAEIVRRMPFVDLVFGPQTYQRLPEMLAKLQDSGAGEPAAAAVNTEFPLEPKFDRLPDAGRVEGTSAFLAVQEGCDKFCTFCVVPYTRGAEYSRPAAQIESEARQLIANGAREITLLGQNVNAYHGAAEDGATLGLGRLITRLARLEGLTRLRYTTSHPRDMDDELIETHAHERKLMPYLHLPVQSGSDRILAAMNRRHRAAEYLAQVAKIRRARPDIALSSDFIVGFPGETEADVAATLALVETVGFAAAYSFKYSARPGTPAAEMPDQVPEPVKEARLQRLQALLGCQQQTFNAACVGREMEILIEKPGRRDGQFVGRSPYLQAVHVTPPGAGESSTWIGRLMRVRIEAARPHSLAGHLVDAEPAGPGRESDPATSQRMHA